MKIIDQTKANHEVGFYFGGNMREIVIDLEGIDISNIVDVRIFCDKNDGFKDKCIIKALLNPTSTYNPEYAEFYLDKERVKFTEKR